MASVDYRDHYQLLTFSLQKQKEKKSTSRVEY
jgi:hypothetical protein